MGARRELLSPEDESQVTGGNRYLILKNSNGGWTMRSGNTSRQYDDLGAVVNFLKKHPCDSYTCPTDSELIEVVQAYGAPLQMWRSV